MSDRKQQIFDACGVHLLKQMKKSRAGSSCAYFGTGGVNCGAQPLLNELAKIDHTKIIQRRSTSGIMGTGVLNHTRLVQVPEIYFKDEFKELTDAERSFAQDIQRIHDGTEPESWHYQLTDLAEKHGLSTAAIEACPTA